MISGILTGDSALSEFVAHRNIGVTSIKRSTEISGRCGIFAALSARRQAARADRRSGRERCG